MAALFLGLYTFVLTLSPAARERSWEVAYRWDHWLAFLVWGLGIAIAHRLTSQRLPERDPYLLPVVALLSGWGCLSIWRLSPFFGLRQSLWLIVAFALLAAGLRLPPGLDFLRRYKYIWLTSGLLLTALTLLFGTNPAGSGHPRLWLGCCGIYLQPSEPLKLLLIVYLAAYFAQSARSISASDSRSENPLLPYLAPTLIMTGLALLLLVFQRDLGTASIFMFLYASMVYIATGKKRIALISGIGLILAGVAGYRLFDVVRLRVDAWINPWLDPSGRSYQIVQSLLAIANGGVLGRGPGLGSPGLVPIPHSDFIFAAMVEESGLVGALGLIGLIALIAARGMLASLYATSDFRRYLAAGLTAYLASQSILIMGGNLRLLPLTGVTLPFVSYGGSSLVTSFLSLLLLLHISDRSQVAPASLPATRPYLNLSALLFAGLAASALITGWWSVYRGPDLLTRTDNARRSIADRYVLRGAILDRGNTPLALSEGKPGAYARRYTHPPFGGLVGYNDPVYGQSGLEASLDDYLRGERGYPGLTLWWNHLLYGQPPPGLDVRTSLDLDLQGIADRELSGHKGALVLLNAQSGEILAMSSQPSFDANLLEEQWGELVKDPDAPLLNRAALGLYPIQSLINELYPGESAREILRQPPLIRLPDTTAVLPEGEPLRLSPLQAALAAAAISADGLRPAPLLVTAVDTPLSGWVILPALDQPHELVPSETAHATASSLSEASLNLWQVVSVEQSGSASGFTWYLGGTQPGSGGAPYALAVLLEEENTSLATKIGQAVLQAAMLP